MQSKQSNKFAFSFLIISTCMVLTSCSSTSTPSQINKSFLNGKRVQATLSEGAVSTEQAEKSRGAEKLKAFSITESTTSTNVGKGYQFDDNKTVSISADDLPLNEFLHYVMGTVLDVSYVLGEGVKADDAKLTLNLQEPITHKALFELVEDMLAERGYVIRLKDKIFFINLADSKTSKKIMFWAMVEKSMMYLKLIWIFGSTFPLSMDLMEISS
ncbi:hypothetical protein [Pseudoalteromonas xiamenensis]